jgi:hypothetical protein
VANSTRQKKLNGTASTYFNKVKAMADTLTSMGQPLRADEFNSYLLAGLDSEYDVLADRVSACPITDPMPMRDVYAQLLNTEQRIEARRAEMSAEAQHMVHYSSHPGGGRPPFMQ